MTINKERAVSDAGAILREERDRYRRGLIVPGIIDNPQLSPNDCWAYALRAVERALAMKAASHPLEQQQAVSGDKLVEQIARLPAQTCGDFDCDAEVGEKTARKIIALTAGVERMRPLIEQAMHELEDSDYPYHRSLGAEIRTALQGGE